MRRRKFFTGFTAAAALAATVIVAAPAGAVLSNACKEGMFLAAAGNSGGLEVACTFTSAGIVASNGSLLIHDYPTAVWNSGAARQVNVNDATAGSFTITSAPAVGQVGITASDIDHSIEGPGIAAGDFVKSVSGTTVTLALKTVAGGGTGKTVLIANSRARAVLDGATFAGTGKVTSATANFAAGDVGMRLSGGSLPDGATIASVTPPSTAMLACTGCIPAGFGSVQNGSSLPITMEPPSAPTSNRFVTDALFTAASTITSTTAKFAASDLGLAVSGTGVPAGTHITATASGGGSATVSPATLPVSGTQHSITVGVPVRTAPVSGEVAGELGIQLTVNPALSPTSPPCSAKKVSAFEINNLWQNPGTYDTSVSSTDFSGSLLPGTSTAQMLFKTSATNFAGFLVQNVTVTGTTATTTGYAISYPFLPIGAGVCTGTGLAIAWAFNGISEAQANNPTNTGPPGAQIRGLAPLPQGNTKTYTGTTGTTPGAFLTTGATSSANQPTNANSCTLSSPIALGWQCDNGS